MDITGNQHVNTVLVTSYTYGSEFADDNSSLNYGQCFAVEKPLSSG